MGLTAILRLLQQESTTHVISFINSLTLFPYGISRMFFFYFTTDEHQ